MISYFELSYFKRIAKTNYILLALMLVISCSAHVIANRLVIINKYPIIAAGFIYMGVFIISDVLASYNPRKLVIFFLVIEALFNLFFVLYVTKISNMPYPSYFSNADAYVTVFGPIPTLYLANLGGTFISAVIDLYIFNYLYNNKKWMFAPSSFLSSIFTISCYTYITDYFGFRNTYPEHVMELTHINLITNFITLFIYALIGQILVTSIQKYLNR